MDLEHRTGISATHACIPSIVLCTKQLFFGISGVIRLFLSYDHIDHTSTHIRARYYIEKGGL